MGRKNIVAVAACATLLMWSSVSRAEEYRPGEYLGLDLSSAVLSPKRLGPDGEFAPVAIEARTDRVAVRTERITRAKPQVASQVARPRPEQVKQARAEKPRGAARARLARRPGNPLDANASDTRIQVWPCKSGGICGWQR